MSDTTIGFAGLGVMGEPMCRNLARKSGHKVLAFDPRPEPLARELAAAFAARGARFADAPVARTRRKKGSDPFS